MITALRTFRYWPYLRFVFLLALALTAVTFPFEFRSRYEASTVAPTQQYFQEMLRIRNLFGYGNQSDVIFVRFDIAESNRLAEWAHSITGMPIYVGSSPFYYLANETETSLLNSAVYVGQTNNLKVHKLFGEPLILSMLLSLPTAVDLLNSTRVAPGLAISRTSQAQALALLPFAKALGDGSPLPLAPGINLNGLNWTGWQLYLAKGGTNNATLDLPGPGFSLTLVHGTYFVRLYQIFQTSLSIPAEDFVAIHVWSSTSKMIMIGLSSQTDPILPGGTTNEYALYSFNVRPGWQYLLLDLTNPGTVMGTFSSSSIAQVIFYLDQDNVNDRVMSDNAYAIGPA